jgi:hypothetical protein
VIHIYQYHCGDIWSWLSGPDKYHLYVRLIRVGWDDSHKNSIVAFALVRLSHALIHPHPRMLEPSSPLPHIHLFPIGLDFLLGVARLSTCFVH